MAHIITLMDTHDSLPVNINVDTINYFRISRNAKNSTLVVMAGGECIEVSETVPEIIELINEIIGRQ